MIPKTLRYGTANFNGFETQDMLCLRELDPAMENSQSHGSCLAHELKEKKCANLKFYSAYEFEGIDKYVDGILGLAPSRSPTHSFVQQLKNQGIVDHAIISFNLKQSKKDE